MIWLAYPRRPERIAKIIGWLIAAIGLGVFAGSLIGADPVIHVARDWPGMSRATALSLFLCGTALAMLAGSLPEFTGPAAPTARASLSVRWARAVAVSATILGFARAWLWIAGLDTDMDALWLPASPGPDPAKPPHMAFATAVSVFALGGALLVASQREFSKLVHWLMLVPGAAGWLSLCRYLYGGEPLIASAQMAIHTTFSLLALCVGVLCLRTEGGVTSLLLSESAGGVMARWLLPPALVVPLLVGWVRLWGQRAGWYGTEAGLSLFAMCNVAFFCALILVTGALLRRSDVERGRAEEANRTALKLVTELQSAVDQHAIVAMTDPRGVITYVNDKFCAISKYSREELLGQDHRLINSGHHSKDFIRNLWSTVAHGQVWHGELKNRAKDGSVYWVDTTIVPFLNAQGKPRQYVAIRADITDRKIAEETLRESQVLYHSLVEQMPVGVFRKNAEGRYVFVNSWFCQLSGGKPEHFLGKTPRESLAALQADKAGRLDHGRTVSLATAGEEHHEHIMRTGERIELDEERYLTGGERLHLRVVKAPIRDEGGRVIGTQGTLIDITERKLAEEEVRRLNTELEQRVARRTAELESVNKELEAFSYSVSHDLRAPLRAVNGFAMMALEDFGPGLPPEGRRQLEKICAGSQRMGQLIDDLLTFARLSRQPVNQQTVDAGRLVAEVLAELRSQHEGRDIEFRVGALPTCRGDVALLKQVWINLLTNAVKYSRGRAPAIVEVGHVRDNGAGVFFVRDNGAGFDMQYAHKLFGVFQRLHRAEEFEGTGVGLAIVQRVVHRHSGRVWATAAPGQGATFYFTLGT